MAEHWKKFDFEIYAKEHWDELGPEIQGKIFIWMRDMDHFYLNPATRSFADFKKATKDPTSDVEFVLSPMAGHCSEYFFKEILLKMQRRLEGID